MYLIAEIYSKITLCVAKYLYVYYFWIYYETFSKILTRKKSGPRKRPARPQGAWSGGLGEEYTHINIGATTLHANHDILQIVDVCEEYQKEEKLAR